MLINKMIINGLIKSLNSTKFINFIKILDFKSRFIINNTVRKRLNMDI